jgi:hypothetical protein
MWCALLAKNVKKNAKYDKCVFRFNLFCRNLSRKGFDMSETANMEILAGHL